MRLVAPLFLLSLASCAPVDVSGLDSRVDGSATATDVPLAADDASAASDRESPSPDGAVVTRDVTTPDASVPSGDAVVSRDLGADTSAALDAPASVDASTAPDTPSATDVLAVTDRGSVADAGTPVDLPESVDRPSPTDVPSPVDAGETQPTLPPPAPFGYAPLTAIERRVGDSGSLADERRTLYAYDAMRRLDTTESQAPAAGGTWRSLTRTTYRYDTAGRLTSASTQIPSGTLWLDSERMRYEYDGAGQRTVDHHDVLTFPDGWIENYRYVWQWESGRPTWRRFWQTPSSGGELYYASYQSYSFEDTGRLRGLGRGDRGSPTGSWSDAGGFTYVAWTNGALRAQDFRRNSTTSHLDYFYAPSGLLRDAVYTATSRTSYVYDASGRLRFVRDYAPDGSGGTVLSIEVELTHTDAGSSYTFALDPHPYATWMTSYYGRGDVLDRYRR